MDPGAEIRFFTVTDDRYFPGVVGLLNSLRLTGHTEPVTVLDHGLTDSQRKVLRPHCDLVSTRFEVRNPCQLKAYPSQLDYRGVVVLIDSDSLVLTRLDEAIREALEGRICMYRDSDETRFFPEWSEIFDLRAPLRRQTYFQSGFVVFSTEAWPDLLDRWWEALQRVWHLPTFMEGAPMRSSPTSQPDQDALNALLMSELPPGAVHELSAAENAVPGRLEDVVVTDLDSLSCSWQGRPVRILHCSGQPKPWSVDLLRARRDTHCFLPLLRRVLTARDVPVRVPNRLLPPWLWRGAVGGPTFRLVHGWLAGGGIRGNLRRVARAFGGPDRVGSP